MPEPIPAVSHEKLDVQQASIAFLCGDQVRFYDIARGSAHECGAVVDVLRTRALIDEPSHREQKTLLHRIVSMLVKLVHP